MATRQDLRRAFRRCSAFYAETGDIVIIGSLADVKVVSKGLLTYCHVRPVGTRFYFVVPVKDRRPFSQANELMS